MRGKKEKRGQHLGGFDVNSNMRGIIGSSFEELLPPNFLPILERKFFCEFEKKTTRPHHLFPFLLTQPNTLQKSISFYFLSKVFYPPYFTSKQTYLTCIYVKLPPEYLKLDPSHTPSITKGVFVWR